MAILRIKQISEMSEKEIEDKIGELKKEIIKNKINAQKSGKINSKEIKRTIARLLTVKNSKFRSSGKN